MHFHADRQIYIKFLVVGAMITLLKLKTTRTNSSSAEFVDSSWLSMSNNYIFKFAVYDAIW